MSRVMLGPLSRDILGPVSRDTLSPVSRDILSPVSREFTIQLTPVDPCQVAILFNEYHISMSYFKRHHILTDVFF